jgi:hypothetical protein
MNLSLGEFMSAVGLASGLLGMTLAALMSRGDRSVTLTCGGVSAAAGIIGALAMYDASASAQRAPQVQAAAPNSGVDYRGISEIISASHHDMPLIVVGITAIAIVAILAKALVRVVEINAQRPRYEQSKQRLEGPREVNCGNLPAVRRD